MKPSEVFAEAAAAWRKSFEHSADAEAATFTEAYRTAANLAAEYEERMEALVCALEERCHIAEADADFLWDAWSAAVISVSFPEVGEHHERALEARL